MRWKTGALLLAAWPAALPAAAQRVEYGIFGGRALDPAGGAHAGVTLATSAHWSAAGRSLSLGAHGTALRDAGMLGGGSARGRWVMSERGAVAVLLEGEGAALASEGGYRAAAGELRPRLRLAAEGWGVEAGPQLALGGRSVGGALDRGTSGGWLLPRTGSGEVARWRSQHGVGVAGWAERGPLAVRSEWQATTLEEIAWQQGSATLALRVGGVTLAARAGARTGGVEERWGAGSAAVRLWNRATLYAEAGVAPSDPLTGRGRGEYASVGLVLRPDASAPLSAPVPVATAGSQRIVLRARPGSRVSVSGDWNGWTGEAVEEVEPGVYAVEVALPRGVYRFAFRVDGEWTVPAGWETEQDGYGGRRAVLRVR